MDKKRSRRRWLLLTLGLLLIMVLLSGCGGKSALTYPASGTVVDAAGYVMAGVTILFDGSGGVQTDAKGEWYKTGLEGTAVTVTAVKDGYTFSPTSTTVTYSSNTNIQFVGTAN